MRNVRSTGPLWAVKTGYINEGEEQTEDKNTESVPVSGTAVAADENDDMIGRIGLEYKEKDEESGIPSGYYLGYAILPKWRKKGLAAKAASRLLKYCFEYWQRKYGICKNSAFVWIYKNVIH